MGGATTEMSETTTRVLVEAAHWDAVSMFRTGRRHKLTSEAGKRNERGVDPTICEAAADRVAELLAEYGGGTVEHGVTVVGTPPEPTHHHHPARPARADHRDGHRLEHHDRQPGGRRVHVEAAADTLTASVPSWRPDLNDPFDLVEEVARIVGYEDVPSVLPTAPRVAVSPPRSRCAVGSVARWRATATSRWSTSRSSARPTSTGSRWRPPTHVVRRCGWPTRSAAKSR